MEVTKVNVEIVRFYDDFLEVVRIAAGNAVGQVDGVFWVSVKRVCENIGLKHRIQYQKLKADPTYEAKLLKVQTAGGPQEMFCIPLDKLNGWLFSINPNRVKPQVKEKLIAYKAECHRVLFEHFAQKAARVQPTACVPENLNAMANGYKGQLKRKQNEIDALRWELVAVKDKLKEAQERKICDGDYLLMEHNLLDLVGALSRHKEELDTYGDLLQTIAKEHKKRMEYVEHLLTQLVKHHPKTRNVAKQATDLAKDWLQETRRRIT